MAHYCHARTSSATIGGYIMLQRQKASEFLVQYNSCPYLTPVVVVVVASIIIIRCRHYRNT